MSSVTKLNWLEFRHLFVLERNYIRDIFLRNVFKCKKLKTRFRVPILCRVAELILFGIERTV